MRQSSLVVVANRLPLDDSAAPDGACEWRRSPGGLASALHAILRADPGHLGRLGRRHRAGTGPAGHRLPADPAGRALRGRPARLLRGLRQLHPVAALPRRRRAARLRPRLVGGVPRRQPPLRRGRRRGRRARRRRLGAGLPPAAGPGDAPRAAARPADRLLPARAVPAARALHAAPPPGRTAARHARRRPGRLPAPAGRPQRGPARHQAARRAATDDQIVLDGRVVRTGAFPVSIDVAEMQALAARPGRRQPARQLRADLGQPRRVLLSVDRLDYTKGIEHRLTAYSELLRDGRVKVRDTVVVQVAVPSRERVEHYQILRDRIEGEVGRINGEYGRVGEPAIHYLNQPFDRADLAALYQTADVMVVTPLRDGMNLVAKEFVAAREDGTRRPGAQRVRRGGRRAERRVPGQPARRRRAQADPAAGPGGRPRRTWPPGCRRCAPTWPPTTSGLGPRLPHRPGPHRPPGRAATPLSPGRAGARAQGVPDPDVPVLLAGP